MSCPHCKDGFVIVQDCKPIGIIFDHNHPDTVTLEFEGTCEDCEKASIVKTTYKSDWEYSEDISFEEHYNKSPKVACPECGATECSYVSEEWDPSGNTETLHCECICGCRYTAKSKYIQADKYIIEKELS